MLTRLTLSALLFATPVLAQEASITLSGEGIATVELTMADLAALPQVTQDVTYMASGEERHVSFTGTPLWPILKSAGLMETAEHNSELRRFIEVAAGDDYVVAFSVGEIHPDFGNAPILLAVTADGAALPAEDGFRLVVPGDTRGARYVRNISTITVH